MRYIVTFKILFFIFSAVEIISYIGPWLMRHALFALLVILAS
jgi:hypothetical protein